jgi:hypothetical protein
MLTPTNINKAVINFLQLFTVSSFFYISNSWGS